MLNSFAEPLIITLVDKLGENLLKQRQAAEEALIACFEHDAFGVPYCIGFLTRTIPPPS